MAFLGIDTASPTVSVAIGDDGETWAVETMPQTRSSRRLLPAIDSLLKQSRCRVEGLDGILVVRGPGSFTGMRVGLATVLGLHQATGVPCATVSTLTGLAASVDEPGGDLIVVVDALRDEWFVQSFVTGLPPEAKTGPERRTTAELVARLGAGNTRVAGHADEDPAGRLQIDSQRSIAAGPLAPALLRLAPTVTEWRWQALTEPLYLRSPAVSLPRGGEKRP